MGFPVRKAARGALSEDPKMARGHWEPPALTNAFSLSHGKTDYSFLLVVRTKSSQKIIGI